MLVTMPNSCVHNYKKCEDDEDSFSLGLATYSFVDKVTKEEMYFIIMQNKTIVALKKFDVH